MIREIVRRIVRSIHGMFNNGKLCSYRFIRILHPYLRHHERTSRTYRGIIWTGYYILHLCLWNWMGKWREVYQSRHHAENELLLGILQPLWKDHSQATELSAIFLQRLNASPAQIPGLQVFIFIIGASCVVSATCGSIAVTAHGWDRLNNLTGDWAVSTEQRIGSYKRNLKRQLQYGWLLNCLHISDLVHLVNEYVM